MFGIGSRRARRRRIHGSRRNGTKEWKRLGNKVIPDRIDAQRQSKETEGVSTAAADAAATGLRSRVGRGVASTGFSQPFPPTTQPSVSHRISFPPSAMVLFVLSFLVHEIFLFPLPAFLCIVLWVSKIVVTVVSTQTGTARVTFRSI